jgi:hypothetical protein
VLVVHMVVVDLVDFDLFKLGHSQTNDIRYWLIDIFYFPPLTRRLSVRDLIYTAERNPSLQTNFSCTLFYS